MKYNIEIEINDDAVKESGLDVESYIHQEMGWLEDSGMRLVSLEKKDAPELQKLLYALMETIEDEEAIRESSIVAVSEDRGLLRKRMQQLVDEDPRGLFQKNGFAARSADEATSEFEMGAGFVSYSVEQVQVLGQEERSRDDLNVEMPEKTALYERKDIEAQIAEARSNSDASGEKSHKFKPIGMEDPSL